MLSLLHCSCDGISFSLLFHPWPALSPREHIWAGDADGSTPGVGMIQMICRRTSFNLNVDAGAMPQEWWWDIVHKIPGLLERRGQHSGEALMRGLPASPCQADTHTVPKYKMCLSWVNVGPSSRWKLPGKSSASDVTLQERHLLSDLSMSEEGICFFHVHFREVHEAKTTSCFACVWTEPRCWTKAFGKCGGGNVMSGILFYFGLTWGWMFCLVWDVLLFEGFLDIAFIVLGN